MKSLFSFLFIALVLNSQTQAQVDYNLGLKSEVYYTTLDEELGANFSHVSGGVNIGGVPWDDIVFNRASVGDIAWQIDAQISGMPSLLRDSTEEKIEENIYKDIVQFVDGSIAANPELAELRTTLISQSFDSEKLKVDDRLDQIVLETSIQEINFSRAWATSENASLSFTFGKGALHSTFSTSDNASLLPDRALTAGGTVGTTYLNLNRTTDFSSGVAQMEIAFFKTRSAWFNAQEFIATVVNMEDKAFDDHEDLFDLNSAMIKAAFNNANYSIGISAAHHADMGEQDGGLEVTLSGTYNFSNGHFSQLTAFNAQDNARSGVDSSYSLLYGIPISESWEIYGNFTDIDGFDDRFTRAREKEDGRSYGVGANLMLYSSERCEVVAEAELVKYSGIKGNDSDTLVGALIDCSLF